jgi:hypothetical protein
MISPPDHRSSRLRRVAVTGSQLSPWCMIVTTAWLLFGLLAPSALASASAPSAAGPGSSFGGEPLSTSLTTELSRNVTQRVIVVMKSQPTMVRAGTDFNQERTSAIEAAQAPIMSELRQVKATQIESYQLVNSLAATVSPGEERWLGANPLVAEVVPDLTLEGVTPVSTATPEVDNAQSRADAASLKTHVIPGACGQDGAVQLAPEGLALTSTASQTPGQRTARSLGIDGSGVKVAFIADGLDPDSENFLRPNGTSVFDPVNGGGYVDFSGDGPGRLTQGDEAFIDATTIAGQGREVYDLNGFSDQSYPSACNIRLEGVAPGARVLGLDVYGTYEDTTESNFLEAINYAVETADVNVLNESFGSSPFSDVPALEVMDQFDNAAVAAGVVVTVSSGDGGSANTIGSPATDPELISVGASTQLQAYAQINAVGARDFATTGWIDDNVSPISSGGFEESGGTVDLVAPGDQSFASCDASPTYLGCINSLGQSDDIKISGGTSEAAPFVAGAAALVIQAYRRTHAGATPTPALVKQILLSTAIDLGAPATEQGAGLLDSARAVELAESIHTADGSPPAIGQTVLASTSQLNAVAATGQVESWPVTLTNTGARAQSLTLTGRAIGPDTNIQTGQVVLNDATSPKFIDDNGKQDNYELIHFGVPTGQDRLDASIAFQANPSDGVDGRVGLMLIDPTGRLATVFRAGQCHSECWPNPAPTDVGNYANVDVSSPVAGTWTGVIFSQLAADHGTNGTVPWRMATEEFIPFGSVSPSHVSLQPEASKTVIVTATAPASPGDSAGAIIIDSSANSAAMSIPVTLRALVDPATGGHFSGVLTGGNGRTPGPGAEAFYQFRVGQGVSSIMADVSLSNDPADPVGSYLVSPDGDVLGFGQNTLDGVSGRSLTATTIQPAPGLWTLVLDFAEPVVGNEVSQTFSGQVRLDVDPVQATGLPQSASQKLTAGTSVTVPVTVTNAGSAPEAVFIDARLDGDQTTTLAPLDQASGVALPLTGNPPMWLVPTQTSAVSSTSTASAPVMFNMAPFFGTPDVASAANGPGALCADSTSATYVGSDGAVTAGVWYAEPDQCGPYAGPAPAATVSSTMVVRMQPFDTTVTSPTGDLWLEAMGTAGQFSPLTIEPGQSAVIDVTIVPEGPAGTVVSGHLYVDDFMSSVPPDGQMAGDELAALPYAYTIK